MARRVNAYEMGGAEGRMALDTAFEHTGELQRRIGRKDCKVERFTGVAGLTSSLDERGGIVRTNGLYPNAFQHLRHSLIGTPLRPENHGTLFRKALELGPHIVGIGLLSEGQ